MTTFTGVIDNVQQVILGSVLSADAASGATVLSVVDTSDFDDREASTINLAGTTYTCLSVDEIANTITLSTGLATAALTDDPVIVWDTITNTAAFEVRAHVVHPAIDAEQGVAVDARVNLALVTLLPLGPRDVGLGEVAECTEVDGVWKLTDLPSVTPQLQGGYLAPGSVPQNSMGFIVGRTSVTIGTVDPQTIATPNDGDLWYDGNNDYQLKQWSASAIPPQWLPYQLGNAALASGAASRTFLQTADPSVGLAMRDSDLWIYVDTNGGMQLNRWDATSSSWVPLVFNTQAIAAASIAAGQILAGSITSVTIQGALSGSMVGKDGGQPSDISQTNIQISDTSGNGGAILIYETVTTVAVTDTTPGNKTWVVPAGVTSAKVECIGSGASGEGSKYGTYRLSGLTHSQSFSGQGGSGGEYAREDAIAVVPGNTYSYTVPAGASGSGTAGGLQAVGSPAVFRSGPTTSDPVVVSAHGGSGQTSAGGSFDSVHFNSGAGGTRQIIDSTFGFQNGAGGGGGASGGSSAAGHNGTNATGTSATAGGTAVTGGGAGGAGAASNTFGAAGAVPGGGGGGGGTDPTGTSRNGGSGANGQVKISYTAWTLVASIASVAGTDPKTGVAYTAGMKVYRPDVFESPGIIGEITMYGGTTAPAGWLICDGSAISRTTYSALFGVIGTAYGAGDGSTTFNIPNFTSNFPRGNTPGNVTGSATHTHPLSSNAWAKIYMINPSATGVAGTRISGVTAWNEGFRMTGTAATALTGVTSGTPLDGNTDSGSSLPPALGVKFLIKT